MCSAVKYSTSYTHKSQLKKITLIEISFAIVKNLDCCHSRANEKYRFDAIAKRSVNDIYEIAMNVEWNCVALHEEYILTELFVTLIFF